MKIKGEKSDEFYLNLKRTSGNIIILECLGPDGDWMYAGNLFTISKEGICLSKDVNPDLGFDLDEKGRLKVIE